MDLNQRLLQLILEKNSDLGFILQESFPLTGTYDQATPAGPIMELRARTDSEPLSTEAASGALDYWRSVATQVSAATPSDETLKNYSHMAVAHGNLLAHNGHPHAAEQTYQISLQIFPRNVDTLINYRRFLLDQGRPTEAATLLNTFRTQHPDLQSQLTKWLPPN
jgi:predicted Zn-dependent protease